MRFIARNLLLAFILSAIGIFASPAVGQGRLSFREPIFGAELDWSALEGLSIHQADCLGSKSYRILARVPSGRAELIFAWGLTHIVADDENPKAEFEYEADSGMVIKKMGSLLLPLGPSSGNIYDDYPELDRKLVTRLMEDYVERLLLEFGSKEELEQVLAKGGFCAHADASALEVLNMKEITCHQKTPSN